MRDPARHHPTSTVRPADFDAFWAEVMAEAARIPLNPTHGAGRRCARPPRWTSSRSATTAWTACGSPAGTARPTAATCRRRIPALLIVPGYVSEPTLPKSWAKLGYAAVGVAPRGKLRSNQPVQPRLPRPAGRQHRRRNTYAYRGFYVDAARAVDFRADAAGGGPRAHRRARQQPGRRADDHHRGAAARVITCGAAGAPYLCGFMDAASLTHSYPYEEINEYLRLYPEREPLGARDAASTSTASTSRRWITLPDAGQPRPARRRLPARDRLCHVRRARLPEGAA